ncbi:hypothetical protein D3C78_1698090 [compost metagenome]
MRALPGAHRVALDRAVAFEAFDALAYGVAREVDLGCQLGVGGAGVEAQFGDDAFVEGVENSLHGASGL